MAKPELDDGFTRIANEILGALSRINLSAYETSVLLFIFRNTYGWQRKEDLLALEFIAEKTAIRKPHVCRTLKRLRKKKMIVMRKDARGFSLYGFQKDYERWAVTWRGNEPYQGVTSGGNGALPGEATQSLPKEVIVTNSGKDITNSGNNVTSLGTQQRKKKERYKENNNYPEVVVEEIPPERDKTLSLYARAYAGIPSELNRSEIELLAEKWGDPVVQDAIREAGRGPNNKPSADYIGGIIYRWWEEGKVKPIISKEEYEEAERRISRIPGTEGS